MNSPTMNIELARALHTALESAIRTAEAAGSDQVTFSIGDALRAMDDKARADAQAAIDAALRRENGGAA
ncbi:MAG: hypothetical protein KF788_08795 [Piscinibacter sp.]|nr:hypothetical protein [Piscinibacter sp.]